MPTSQTRKLLTIEFDHRGLLELQEDYNMRWLAASYFIVIWLQILVCNGILANLVPYNSWLISLWSMKCHFIGLAKKFVTFYGKTQMTILAGSIYSQHPFPGAGGGLQLLTSWFHHTCCTPFPSAAWSAWVWSEDSKAWSHDGSVIEYRMSAEGNCYCCKQWRV